MTTTLLKNGLILTVNENSDIFPGDILIKGNTIEQIAEKIVGVGFRLGLTGCGLSVISVL